MLINNKFFLLTLSFLLISSTLHPRQGKKLTIKGSRIFTEEELFSRLQLNRFEEGKKPLAEVITSIEKYYKQKNYKLVKVYHTDIRTSNEYALFIDEGRLGKIVVHNLNKYYTLKFKQMIDIPERIYNSDIIDQNLKKIKTEFPESVIKVELQIPPDYDGNLLQLDRELEKLKLGEIFDTTFFDQYTPVHDLHFFVTDKKRGSDSDDRYGGFGYDIHYKFPSVLIPEIDYYNENILFKKDYLESSLSAGFDSGLNGLYKIPPSNTLLFPPKRTFIELTGEYKVTPIQNKIVGPLVRGRIFHSNATRPDLGITEYKYFTVRSTLAPEFLILNKLKIYTGLGLEQIKIYDTAVDHSAEKHLDASDNYYQNSFAEARIKFDPIPVRIGNKIDKYIIMTYTDYLSGNSSKEFEIKCAYETELDNQSIISLKSRAINFFNNTPFYKNEEVNDSYFKGFSGKSYYTNKEISLSGEYRFSIYQDFIYTGAFIDWVAFEPVGYFLSGKKQGINIGPTGRIQIYDQFEFIIHFGFDRLFPDNEAGTSIKMRLTKKL